VMELLLSQERVVALLYSKVRARARSKHAKYGALRVLRMPDTHACLRSPDFPASHAADGGVLRCRRCRACRWGGRQRGQDRGAARSRA
jgi:hypothetical protein